MKENIWGIAVMIILALAVGKFIIMPLFRKRKDSVEKHLTKQVTHSPALTQEQEQFVNDFFENPVPAAPLAINIKEEPGLKPESSESDPAEEEMKKMMDSYYRHTGFEKPNGL